MIASEKMLHHVEDLKKLDNEPLCLEVLEPYLGTYVVTDDHKEPIIPHELE
jgi:hypothetical protein